MPNSRSEQHREYISIRLDPILRRKIEKESAIFGLKMSPMIRFMIAEYFRRVEKEAEAERASFRHGDSE